MKNQYKYIGQRIQRPDALDKAIGKTKYAGELKRHNMLYGKLVVSNKAHAKVKIDKTEALKISDIEAVFTYEDVPKKPYSSNDWYPGNVSDPDELILHETARHVGDRIALIVGRTKESVEMASRAIIVTYDELPIVSDIKSAKNDDITIWGGTNLCFEKKLSCGDTSSAFEKADYIIEDKGSTPKIHHAAIENHVCMAETDDQGNIIIWTPCQVVFQVQHVTSMALDIPYGRIRVVKTVIGGSFGGKGMPVLEPICAFATLKTGKPVLIAMDRKLSIASTRMRNASEQHVKIGITKEGKIVAREIEIEFDGGAYFTNASAIVVSAGKKAFRTYNIENQNYNGKTYYTNTTPGGACRGYGSPQVHAITEINMNNAASKIGMDPIDFRIKNAFSPSLDSLDSVGMPGIGNARIIDCLEMGRVSFKWVERMNTVKSKNTSRYSHGLGIAVSAHGNGYHGAFPDFTNVSIRILPDGYVYVKIGIHDLGCGTVLTMQQIVAEVLDIDIEKDSIPQADTLFSPYDSAGTQASRVTYVCGGAVKEASEKLKKKMITLYSKVFNVLEADVYLESGSISSQTAKRMNFGEFANYIEKTCHETISENIEYQSKANPAVYSAVFTEVKVDRLLGLVEILDMMVIQDAGQIINRTLAEGQVQGGAHMSIGMALCEEILYDDNGQLKTDNFSKYHLINAPSMPEIRVDFIEEGDSFGPFGAKSVGELAAVAPAPSIMNAINHALGTNLTVYPATPERIIKALYPTQEI